MTDALEPHSGNPQKIVEKINTDRKIRNLKPVFLHRALSDVAQVMGERYANANPNPSYFDRLVVNRLEPLGTSVSASYTTLRVFKNDKYVDRLKQTIKDTLFDSSLEAVGVYEAAGVYTLVLASGLTNYPLIEMSPDAAQYVPPDYTGKYSTTVENGIDVPAFVTAMNRERRNTGVDVFAVHTLLHKEAWKQVVQMSKQGHSSVYDNDADVCILDTSVRELFQTAGDGFQTAKLLVDSVLLSYGSIALDQKYNAIGVAQKDGYWSVIFGSCCKSVGRCAYPQTLDKVDYIS
ncbi:hypothetical protein IW139_001876 [Coemansia sp. RSA 353]|nr:hypothetical protein IW142_002335 [Coemansia sp. RSA 564]KAJ2181290.1 hypothetical protein EV181_005262 [Coemansia sp. RSA 532]KAJ2223975.1 hypothetical protein IW143_000766 [Coemansia sp. RSA 520]KAJ2228195.1 hypothetical protein EV180_002104 [Coemansia sp. RSA 518]KAJ2275913.1 hypothetical protein J3F81_001601 [Coemansia sp. RSA 371]KAJ2290213.1 hypothetical protein IW141_003404 [Coemansia sp. RSA 355]KAJ2299168.1 hypothetical protein IW139_001876 [Coemansia sp. RSA 353]